MRLRLLSKLKTCKLLYIYGAEITQGRKHPRPNSTGRNYRGPKSLVFTASSVSCQSPVMQWDQCEVFAVFTLATTATWVYMGRNWSLRTLALAMFFPGLFAPWFSDDPDFLSKVLGSGHINKTVMFSVFGGILTILILSSVVMLIFITGWGEFDERYKQGDPGDLLGGLFRAAGEEVGWRCFLLPCLIQKYGTVGGLFLSGVVWGLYHVPVMVLLTRRCKTPHPVKTVIVQALSCVFSAVPHGWLAIKSGYALWAPTVMHWTWNRFNPVATGSVYSNERGKIKGPLWLVNGEGLAGILVMVPVNAVLFYSLLNT